jgi:hypothetical protein
MNYEHGNPELKRDDDLEFYAEGVRNAAYSVGCPRILFLLEM